jgi:hypothetical protein
MGESGPAAAVHASYVSGWLEECVSIEKLVH